jgi:NADH:ubiquinone oxidoreductase subunit 6 (subunit J)
VTVSGIYYEAASQMAPMIVGLGILVVSARSAVHSVLFLARGA